MKEVGGYEFKVPNNEEGQLFLSLFKKYLNKRVYRYRLRGNAKNRRAIVEITGNYQHLQQSVPQKYADEFRVYLDHKPSRYAFVDGMYQRIV